MGLKGTGKIYQEMVEVEEDEKGLGCFSWLVIVFLSLVVLFYALEFVLQNPLISVIGIIAIVAIIKKVRK